MIKVMGSPAILKIGTQNTMLTVGKHSVVPLSTSVLQIHRDRQLYLSGSHSKERSGRHSLQWTVGTTAGSYSPLPRHVQMAIDSRRGGAHLPLWLLEGCKRAGPYETVRPEPPVESFLQYTQKK